MGTGLSNRLLGSTLSFSPFPGGLPFMAKNGPVILTTTGAWSSCPG